MGDVSVWLVWNIWTGEQQRQYMECPYALLSAPPNINILGLNIWDTCHNQESDPGPGLFLMNRLCSDCIPFPTHILLLSQDPDQDPGQDWVVPCPNRRQFLWVFSSCMTLTRRKEDCGSAIWRVSLNLSLPDVFSQLDWGYGVPPCHIRYMTWTRLSVFTLSWSLPEGGAARLRPHWRVPSALSTLCH